MLDIVCDHTPFCISREYLAASETAGMVVMLGPDGRAVRASAEAVERLGVRIEWVSNDVYTEISPARLRQTCRDDVCVVFRVSCQDLTCSWQAAPVTEGSPPTLSEVRLIAADPAALERAKANVFVAVPGPIASLLPLSTLGRGEPAPPGDYSGPASEADMADQRSRRPWSD